MNFSFFYTELYEISVGEKTYYFTSTKADIEYNNNIYKSISIKRGRVRNIIFDETTITTFLKYEPFYYFLIGMPYIPFKVKIYLYILTIKGAQIFPIFEGFVNGYSIMSNGKIELKVQSYLLLLNKKIPNKFYTKSCRFEVFSKECGLSVNSGKIYIVSGYKYKNYLFKTSPILLKNLNFLDEKTILFDELKSENDIKFLHGSCVIRYCENVNGDITNIEKEPILTKNLIIGYDHITGKVELLYPIYYDTIFNFFNDENLYVEFWMGCPKDYEYCKQIFGNEVNFGGFPDLAQSNPSFGDITVTNPKTSIM